MNSSLALISSNRNAVLAQWLGLPHNISMGPTKACDKTGDDGWAADPEGTITQILKKHRAGDDRALGDAILAVYGDLKRIAARHMRSERRTPTFDTESLIHEVFLLLVGQDRTQWQNRNHLFAVAAQMMRRTLVDRARRRRSERHGGQLQRTTLEDNELISGKRRLEVLALEGALLDLEKHDPGLAQLVELRFFGGMTNDEIGAVQGVTSMTVIRKWRLARAWLHRYLQDER